MGRTAIADILDAVEEATLADDLEATGVVTLGDVVEGTRGGTMVDGLEVAAGVGVLGVVGGPVGDLAFFWPRNLPGNMTGS